MQSRGGWITLERGYTSTKTFKYEDGGENHVKVHTYWTQKGAAVYLRANEVGWASADY